MSSEAITRNDLTNILNGVLPPTPSEYKKLLWTNTQGAQTAYSIPLDASKYDAIEVEIERYGNIQTVRIPPTATTGFIYALYDSYEVGRAFTLTSTTLSFSNGFYFSVYLDSNAKAYGAGYCVPTKIYGIKYERVAPPQVDASDYVVEQGTETINGASWTYHKWNSGVAECWGTWSDTLTHYGTSFGGYAFYTTVSFPTGLFTDVPVVTYSGTVGSGFALTGTILAGTKDSVNCYAIGSTGNTQPVNFYLICKGRWK